MRVLSWNDLEVGHSFLVPWPKPRAQMDPYDVRAAQRRVAWSIGRIRQRAVPKKWTQRTVDDGIRVWRVQ